MADKTNISWTSATLNAVRGCQTVSAGCDRCYAMILAARFSGAGLAYEGLATKDESGEARWTGAIKMIPEKLEEPIRWQHPRRIFVNSMSDLFYARVPTSFVDLHWAAFALAPQHQFQILTKRPERMARYLLDPEQPSRVIAQAKKLLEEGQQAGKNWARRLAADPREILPPGKRLARHQHRIPGGHRQG